MRDAIFAYEPFIRLGAFGSVLAAMAIWELVGPRRKQAIGRLVRWPNNLGVVVVDTLLVRLVIPTTAVGLALAAQAHAWGLFNTIALPAWIAVVCSVILLDLAVAVLIFEVVLNATSMFNHGNIRIPLGFDRVLRWFVVTPDMHRVHHSILSRETNSNFGFNLPWWDRLFGTYRAQPAAGHDAMTIGIEQFRDARELRLDRMLLQPFRGEAGPYPLGRREGGR